MDVYGERNPGRIKAILQAQLKERKRRSKRERHKGSLKNWSRPPGILFSRSDFDFRNLDQFVGQVISQHAQRFDPDKLEKKHESFSRRLTQLRKDDSSINYQAKGNIERNLLLLSKNEKEASINIVSPQGTPSF